MSSGVISNIVLQRLRDNLGRTEVSEVQNLFDADFEYSAQPMRWEIYTAGGGSAQQISAQGGVQMSVTGAAGDLVVRQTRPYIRYQPGKTIYMSSGFLFGTAYINQRQRVGFFDDANGIFFEQADPTIANPSGMYVVYRSDVGGLPSDTRIPYTSWTDPDTIKAKVNFGLIQMYWVEYAWYGAGLLRWGVVVDGEPYVLHQVGIGNLPSQTFPWSRTGNLPARYELRNVGPVTTGTSPYTMYHYGVSVLAKGKIDDQRGFTYGYGMAAGTPTRSPGSAATRYPLLSVRYRNTGTLEYGVDTNYSGANGILPAGGAAITSSSVLAAQIATSTITGTTLTVGSVTSGALAVGQLLVGTNVAQGTVIVSGSGTSWQVSVSQTVTSTTMYATAGTVVTASSATWTVNQWVGKYLWSRGSSTTAASFTATSNVVTVTTSSAHFLLTGRLLTFSGGTLVTGSPNGTYSITVTGPTTFTYNVASGSGTAGGTLVYTQGNGAVGRIIANTATTLTIVDNVQGTVAGGSITTGIPYPMVNTPAVGGNYIIGLIDRGQILPRTLSIYSSANCTLELISSTITLPLVLTGATFNTMYSLGSLNSFVERDVSATGLTGGEVVYNTPLPAGALQTFDLSNFFPLYNNVQGSVPDILTVAITTPSGFSGSVGASIIAQEQMS